MVLRSFRLRCIGNLPPPHEHKTAVEINIAAMILNPHYPDRFRERYVEYLAELQLAGVMLSVGSDCHTKTYDIDFEEAGDLLDCGGVVDNFFRLDSRKG